MMNSVENLENICSRTRIRTQTLSQSTTSSLPISNGLLGINLDAMFDIFCSADSETIVVSKVLNILGECGLRKDDPRLANMMEKLHELEVDRSADELGDITNIRLDRETFRHCISSNVIISKVLGNDLVIPDWSSFCLEIQSIFTYCAQFDSGKIASYIPQLSRVDSKSWGASVCTVDGQRKSWGDYSKMFCLQSVSKPFTYATALDQLGSELVHKFVGQEPSGRLFNEICLDHNNKPHNPLINAGAIVIGSLIKQKDCCADRFDFAMEQFKRFGGNGHVAFNNSIFLSERDSADRNYAIAYYLREYGCFPPESKLQEVMDFYFQMCSIETNTDTLAVMAATLANGGVCPLTEERIICNRACRDTLSLMYSCGMYDYSGEFAFKVGLPAKSGVSGALILVVPNLMGICLYSPLLDHLGNTLRGVKFAETLVDRFNLHKYDSILYRDSQQTYKIDPRGRPNEFKRNLIVQLLFAAKAGDLGAVRRSMLLGADVNESDYDGRTALHVAAREGHLEVVRFLLKRHLAETDVKDCWGRTPLDDARNFGQNDCVTLLEQDKHM